MQSGGMQEFNHWIDSVLEPQNVEQGIMNFEVPVVLGFTSAVRNSLFDIQNFRYYLEAYRIAQFTAAPAISRTADSFMIS